MKKTFPYKLFQSASSGSCLLQYSHEFMKKNGGALTNGEVPRELTIHEIEQFEGFMVEQAIDLYSLGFDGIELHTSHSYLLHLFLLSLSNLHEDMHSGNTENRYRIVTNLIERIRKRVGPNKALGLRI